MVMELEEAWNILENVITKVKNMVEGVAGLPFTPRELPDLYTLVYKLSARQVPFDDAPCQKQKLFEKYLEAYVEYINSKVLLALRAKGGEDMLKEFVKRWDNHKFMVEWLSMIFLYLNRIIFEFFNEFFILGQRVPRSVREMGMIPFVDLVYDEMKVDVKDAVIALMNHEREGRQIDRQLVKRVLEIFVEIGMEAYENDFETFMLEDTVAYYRNKAWSWTACGPSRCNYMRKTQECLEREKDRVDHYLHASSAEKLLEKGQEELVSHYKKLHVRCVLG